VATARQIAEGGHRHRHGSERRRGAGEERFWLGFKRKKCAACGGTTGIRIRHVSAKCHGDPFFLCFPQYEPCIERSTAWEAQSQAPRSHRSFLYRAPEHAAWPPSPSSHPGIRARQSEARRIMPLRLWSCTVQMPVIGLRCEEEEHGWDERWLLLSRQIDNRTRIHSINDQEQRNRVK
jgi:hypothetical protein